MLENMTFITLGDNYYHKNWPPVVEGDIGRWVVSHDMNSRMHVTEERA